MLRFLGLGGLDDAYFRAIVMKRKWQFRCPIGTPPWLTTNVVVPSLNAGQTSVSSNNLLQTRHFKRSLYPEVARTSSAVAIEASSPVNRLFGSPDVYDALKLRWGALNATVQEALNVAGIVSFSSFASLQPSVLERLIGHLHDVHVMETRQLLKTVSDSREQRETDAIVVTNRNVPRIIHDLLGIRLEVHQKHLDGPPPRMVLDLLEYMQADGYNIRHLLSKVFEARKSLAIRQQQKQDLREPHDSDYSVL